MSDVNPPVPHRKRGRKALGFAEMDRKRLLEFIQQRVEAIPNELASELGWARSTLAYNLNKLLNKGLIEKIGGGRSTRYRIVSKERGDISG